TDKDYFMQLRQLSSRVPKFTENVQEDEEEEDGVKTAKSLLQPIEQKNVSNNALSSNNAVSSNNVTPLQQTSDPSLFVTSQQTDEGTSKSRLPKPGFGKKIPENIKKGAAEELLLQEKKAKPKGHLLKGTVVIRGIDNYHNSSNQIFDLKGVRIRTNLLDAAEQKMIQASRGGNDMIDLKKVFDKANGRSAETDALEMDMEKRLKYLNRQIAEQGDLVKTLRKETSRHTTMRRSSSAGTLNPHREHSRGSNGSRSEWEILQKKTRSIQDLLLHGYQDESSSLESTNDDASQEKANTKIIEALARKLQLELDMMTEKMKGIKSYQTKKAFMLASFKTNQNIFSRNIRDRKGAIPGLQNKERTLNHYLKETWKSLFAKEKARNQKLRHSALSIQSRYERHHTELHQNLEDVAAAKEELSKASEYLNGNAKIIAFDVRKLTEDIQYLKDNMEKLSVRKNNLKVAKNYKIQEMVLVDSSNHQRDASLMEKALERRKAMGVDVKSVKELDILDLQDCELDRVFLHFLRSQS
ncbi:MAG: hypothetical protein WCI18_15570, partial [Pseudomonadota bacterium]